MCRSSRVRGQAGQSVGGQAQVLPGSARDDQERRRGAECDGNPEEKGNGIDDALGLVRRVSMRAVRIAVRRSLRIVFFMTSPFAFGFRIYDLHDTSHGITHFLSLLSLSTSVDVVAYAVNL